ncbi:hypothetical protein CPC08DRAFT_211902 [Agrocybe pediades]|nr:hypothetical protein CPC08DRAFT_211902 [Agrocybe pediades]
MYPKSPHEQAMKLLYTVGGASTGLGTFNVYPKLPSFKSTQLTSSTQRNSFDPTTIYRNHLYPTSCPKSDGVMICQSTVAIGLGRITTWAGR